MTIVGIYRKSLLKASGRGTDALRLTVFSTHRGAYQMFGLFGAALIQGRCLIGGVSKRQVEETGRRDR